MVGVRGRRGVNMNLMYIYSRTLTFYAWLVYMVGSSYFLFMHGSWKMVLQLFICGKWGKKFAPAKKILEYAKHRAAIVETGHILLTANMRYPRMVAP